ncbi:mycofactocin precursor MftA [Nocardia altamirensis]|nr:mycofactocin precursor MftA [Nocardia altamirensis]
MPEYGATAHTDTDNSGTVGTVETTQESAPLVEETLIEEVSIDGMCGVY